MIDINKPYARTEYKSGKIKAIGNINFEYAIKIHIKIVHRIRELMENSKSMSGEDDRIRIKTAIFDKNKDESIADEIKKFKELLDSGAW